MLIIIDSPRFNLLSGRLLSSNGIVWREEHLRVVGARGYRPWRCARCQGSRVWWSLSHAPVCAACVPMPPEVYDAAWRDAAKLITRLVQSAEDPAERTVLRAALDDILLRGNLIELLRYGVVHMMLELREKKRDKGDR